MKLTQLRLAQFRNFVMQEVSFRPRLNFIVGANGQGKTNLLEAVYILSRGESFRSSKAEHLIRSPQFAASPPQLSDAVSAQARLSAVVESEAGKQNLVVDFFQRRRQATLDTKRTGFSTLSAKLPVVLFSPESLAAIKEGPEYRRELVDSLLTIRSEADATLLREYAKTLRSRNILLKQIAQGDTRSSTAASLESLTTVFLIIASQVTELRLRALEGLLPFWRRSAAEIFQAAAGAVDVDIAYEISGENAIGWSAGKVFDAISQRQQELAERETRLGASLIGPHKHDLRFLLNEKDSRFYSSQGQQRALILAFKIAQINLHHATRACYPILLLDDVMSELDEAKRTRLMEYLERVTAQVLITATDLTWSREFSLERNAVFEVETGRVTLAKSGAVRAVGGTNLLEDAEM